MQKLHKDLPFLPERIKIEKEKLLANLHDKTKYAIHIRKLKQEINHGSVIYKVHKVIKFDRNAWLKQYTDINTDLRKKAKNNFEKFFKLVNAVFGKTMKNVKKHRYKKLVIIKRRGNYLVLESNYHTTNFLQKIY